MKRIGYLVPSIMCKILYKLLRKYAMSMLSDLKKLEGQTI